MSQEDRLLAIEKRLDALEAERLKPKKQTKIKSTKPKGPLVEGILETIDQEVQTTWLLTYGDTSWICHELTKALNWCVCNPQKAPKSNFQRFYGSWLARAYEQHRKTIKASGSGLTF
jgi:hypothetical protein